jgi:hypothetical protein
MAMGFGNCSSSDYDVLLTILGGSSVDVESICTTYNVSAIGSASAALAFEFREVGQFRSVNGSLWVLGEGNVEKRGQTSGVVIGDTAKMRVENMKHTRLNG